MIGLTIYGIKRPIVGNLSGGPAILIKTELLALASVCDEIADNIEDHAPRGPLSKLS